MIFNHIINTYLFSVELIKENSNRRPSLSFGAVVIRNRNVVGYFIFGHHKQTITTFPGLKPGKLTREALLALRILLKKRLDPNRNICVAFCRHRKSVR